MDIPSSNASGTNISMLRGVQSRDPSAWDRMVAFYQERLKRWCLAQGLSLSATEDVLQETWISVAKSIAQFSAPSGSGAFRAWLFRILRRRMIDYHRRHPTVSMPSGGSSILRFLEAFPDPHAQTPASQISSTTGSRNSRSNTDSAAPINNSFESRLCIVRSRFEDRTWHCFELCIIDQKSTEEVATQLQLSPASVRQNRSRVLRALRKEFGTLHVPDSVDP